MKKLVIIPIYNCIEYPIHIYHYENKINSSETNPFSIILLLFDSIIIIRTSWRINCFF